MNQILSSYDPETKFTKYPETHKIPYEQFVPSNSVSVCTREKRICSLSFARKKRKLKLKQFGYSLSIAIKLLVRFVNHCNDSVIFDLVRFDSTIRFGFWLFLPTPITIVFKIQL